MPSKTLSAGFAQVDITPPVGTHKIGWLRDIVGDTVLDPLQARAAVLDCGGVCLVLVELDTLSIRWTQVDRVRRRVQSEFGVPGGHVLIAATHNHCGPPVANCGDVRRDEAYIATLEDRIVAAIGLALAARRPAEVGVNSVFEFNVAFNRRVVMRDGTVRTHGNFKTPQSLCLEGGIDPEVAVLAARTPDGAPLGCIVNFACHPTHEGGGTGFSGGFPGVLARELKARGWPVALFLNGACGNTHTADPVTGVNLDMASAGRRLAEDAATAVDGMTWRREVALSACSRTVPLPYRKPTRAQVRGIAKGAQRFVDPAIYDRTMDALLQRIAARGTQPAEVQALNVDEFSFVGIPAEYFVEHGLRIKEETWPRRALVVSHANGMVGYVPTRQAFRRGGYETTFGATSRMAPEAGDILAAAAIALVRGTRQAVRPAK